MDRIESRLWGLTSAVTNHLTFGVILVIGVLLRLYRISYGHGPFSLRNDEVFTQRFIELPIGELLATTAQDVHPPLFYLVSKAWAYIFGASYTSLRVVAAIFGVLGLILVYQFVSRFFTRRASIYAMLFMSVSWYHVFKSQDARMYTMAVAFALISMYGHMLLIRTSNRRRAIAYTTLGTVLLAYTHYYFVFLSIAQFSHLAIHFFRRRSRQTVFDWIISQTLAGVAYIPWLAFWTPYLLADSPSGRYGYSYWTGFTAYIDYFSGSPPLAACFSFAIFAALIAWQRDRLDRSGVEFLILIGIANVPVIYIASKLVGAIRFHPRYTILALPAFYILAAAGVDTLDNDWIRQGIVGIIVILSLFRVFEYFTIF